jgi:predicted flap endonuclease-1-like 5' DNA nuclease
MAEITALHIAILAGSVAAGAVIGWLVRGSRCDQEKVAVNEGWQKQLEAQRIEHSRLLDQNKGLMEQVNRLQASGKDGSNRARELSEALKEAFERRDELQRELKEIRSNLEVAVRQREKLQSDIKDTTARGDTAQAELKRKDDKIFRLRSELENWQNRLPPLIERYRQRDEEAVRLEEELEATRERIAVLENRDRFDADETRVEASGPGTLGEELDASNDPDGLAKAEPVDVPPEEDDEVASFSDFVDGKASDTDVETPDDVADVPKDDDALPEESLSAADGVDESAEPFWDTEIAEPVRDELPIHADDDNDDDDEFVDDVETEGRAIEEEAAEDLETDEGSPVEDLSSATVNNGEGDNWASTSSAEITRIDDPAPGTGGDDLQLIKGIGPAIEKTLNELGIFRYDQIADMSEYDIDRVARRLKGFRSRIYREDWIGQARDLQLQKTAN